VGEQVVKCNGMQRSEREGKQVERPHAEWSRNVFMTSNRMQTSERKGKQVERPHAEWHPSRVRDDIWNTASGRKEHDREMDLRGVCPSQES